MPDASVMPLGICVLPEPKKNAARSVQYTYYIFEILAHAGLCHSRIGFEELADALPQLRVLVTIGETVPPDHLALRLRRWVEEGGSWISIGGVCGIADVFGVEKEDAPRSWMGGICTLGEGYLTVVDSLHPVLSHLEIPLHFFNGLAVKATGGRALAGSRMHMGGRPSAPESWRMDSAREEPFSSRRILQARL